MRKFYELLGILDFILDLRSKLGDSPQISFLTKMIKNSNSFGSEIPLKNYLKLLSSLGLLDIQDEGNVIVTKKGHEFYKLKNQPGSILNGAQKIQIAFFLFSNTNSIGGYYTQYLSLFHYEPENNWYICDYTSKTFPYDGRQWLEEMLYLTVVSDCGSYLVINVAFIPYLCFHQKKRITQEELDKKLKRNKEIGDEKEELALKFEQSRLKKLNKNELSLRVKLISKEFANAGFDMLSFSGKSLFYDRFIEVKSSADGISFFITENEIQTSKILGERFYVYIISVSPNSGMYRVKMIKNFYNYLEDEKIILTPVKYRAHINDIDIHQEVYSELKDFEFLEINND